MFDEISFLVQETFKDAESSQGAKGLFNNFFSKKENLPDEVPGFFYHLQKKASTFVIRIYPSENLKQDYINIVNHPDLYPTLRLQEDEGTLEEKLKFFECDRIEIAKNIKQHLGNKRFPIFEERVFNVSDPGDSWWLSQDGNTVNIHFKLSRTQSVANLVKLGPLGESKRYLETFGKLGGYFNMIFPIADYSSAHGQLSITCSENENYYFDLFKQLLEFGETSHDFWEYLRKLEVDSQHREYLDSLQKANYFLMELGFIRHFWKKIEEEL